MPEKFTKDEALQVLMNAVQIAQSKGAFTLDEAELVAKCIEL